MREAVRRGHARQQRRRHDRVRRTTPVGAALVQPPAEQPAHLVAAQHAVGRPAVRAAVARGHGHRAAVGVRVVGDHDVGVALDALLEREVHRAGLLGVREGDGREVGVGPELRRHHARRREPRAREGAQHDVAADAVHRGVGDRHVARRVGRARARRRRARYAVSTSSSRRVQPSPRGTSRTAPTASMHALISRVGGRHDLRAVAEVDLVAVVLRRVVARGDHDAGGARRGGGWRRRARASAAGAAARARACPAPSITSAVSCANASDLCRAS